MAGNFLHLKADKTEGLIRQSIDSNSLPPAQTLVTLLQLLCIILMCSCLVVELLLLFTS